VASVNYTLDMELEAGEVILTRAYQAHAERRHPDDYAKCLPHLASVIANPLYIGDDFDNADGIEIIGRVHTLRSYLLVAIKIKPDENGRYQVATFHLATEGKIASRRAKGFLKIAVLPPSQKA
jgi:hypothetical protein